MVLHTVCGYDEETGTVGYIQDTLVYAEPKPTRPSYNDVWSTADGLEWVCHTEHAAFRRRHYHEVAAFDSKLWVLEGYNGHPLRYPEEPPDAELLPVGAEGNRNGKDGGTFSICHAYRLANPDSITVADVWYSSDGVEWFEVKDTPWEKRHAASVTAHGDALWISVGNTPWTGSPKLNGAEGADDESAWLRAAPRDVPVVLAQGGGRTCGLCAPPQLASSCRVASSQCPESTAKRCMHILPGWPVHAPCGCVAACNCQTSIFSSVGAGPARVKRDSPVDSAETGCTHTVSAV